MEIKFIKEIEVTLDFSPEQVAELGIKEYKEEYGEDDMEGVYDYIGDNLYYFLRKAGLSEEDEEAMTDGASDPADDFYKALVEYIENKYNY